ncbi:MAG: efflux RND transporter permease subunit, partial [Hydrogenobacter sp.]
VYTQVGVITLIGLSAKNAILLVEFAEQKLKDGSDLLGAILEAARIRFRPIIMTSFAFIMGSLPLALATGPSAGSRHIIGFTVVGGMLALTLVGTFFIPVFYYVVKKVQGLRRKEVA